MGSFAVSKSPVFVLVCGSGSTAPGSLYVELCPLLWPFTIHRVYSTDMIKVLLSSLPLVSLHPADSGQQAELRKSVKFQPSPVGLC